MGGQGGHKLRAGLVNPCSSCMLMPFMVRTYFSSTHQVLGETFWPLRKKERKKGHTRPLLVALDPGHTRPYPPGLGLKSSFQKRITLSRAPDWPIHEDGAEDKLQAWKGGVEQRAGG